MFLFKLLFLKLIHRDFRTFQNQTGWIFEDGFQEIKTFKLNLEDTFNSEFTEVFPSVEKSINESKILTIFAEYRTFKLYSWCRDEKNVGLMFSKGGYQNNIIPSNHLELFSSKFGSFEASFNSPHGLFSYKLGLSLHYRTPSSVLERVNLDDYIIFERRIERDNVWIPILDKNAILYNIKTNQILVLKKLQIDTNLDINVCLNFSDLINELFLLIRDK